LWFRRFASKSVNHTTILSRRTAFDTEIVSLFNHWTMN
jgi:hypothetical protein